MLILFQVDSSLLYFKLQLFIISPLQDTAFVYVCVYIYIYIYTCVCARACVCVCVCTANSKLN